MSHQQHPASPPEKRKSSKNLWANRAQRNREFNERAMTRARNMFKDGETYADRRGRIFLDVDEGASRLHAPHEDHDANDNSQTSPMNTTTTHPTNVINTYTTNSTNSFRMSTTTQPLNMANSQPLNTSIPPVTSAALAQHNGAPGNRPGVKVRADLFPGAELWHLTYSTPPFQNVPVPTDSWTVLSGVSLKTPAAHAVVWGAISDQDPNALPPSVWENVIYLPPTYGKDAGFWTTDRNHQIRIRRVTAAQYAVLSLGRLYVAYAR